MSKNYLTIVIINKRTYILFSIVYLFFFYFHNSKTMEGFPPIGNHPDSSFLGFLASEFDPNAQFNDEFGYEAEFMSDSYQIPEFPQIQQEFVTENNLFFQPPPLEPDFNPIEYLLADQSEVDNKVQAPDYKLLYERSEWLPCPECDYEFADPKEFLIHVKEHKKKILKEKELADRNPQEDMLKKITSLDINLSAIKNFMVKFCQFINKQDVTTSKKSKRSKDSKKTKSKSAKTKKSKKVKKSRNHGKSIKSVNPAKTKKSKEATSLMLSTPTNSKMHPMHGIKQPKKVASSLQNKISSKKISKKSKDKNKTKRNDKAPCPKCGKVFAQKESLFRHYARYHADNKISYNCPECKKTFDDQEKAEIHCNKKCDKCNKTFSSAKTLDRHMKKHREEKYQCQNCGKKFAFAKDSRNCCVTYHCKACKVNFKSIDELLDHRKTH